MRKKQIAITLGIMCFILSMLVAVQIRTINSANSTASQSLSDNALRDSVLKWKERYDNVYAELKRAEKNLESVRQKATQNDTTAEAKEAELKQNNTILGLTTVTGSGIIIELRDGSGAEGDSIIDKSEKLVHNGDLLSLVNELRNAGAEAIEINGERVINTSSITCEGNVIKINGKKIGSPFTIKAIGSQGLLYGQLLRLGSYIDAMKEAGVIVNVVKNDNITIEKYNGVINFKNIKATEVR